MGQIIGGAAKPKRCNLNKLSQLGTPAAGQHILVSTDNSATADGQGNFDAYVVGDGVTAAKNLPLHKIESEAMDILLTNVDGVEIATKNGSKYIRYSDGVAVGSGNWFDVFVLPNDNYTFVKAKLASAGDDVAAIAFYSTDTISANGYMLSASVKHLNTYSGGATYYANVPDGCKLIAFTNRNPYLAEPVIELEQNNLAKIGSELSEFENKIGDPTADYAEELLTTLEINSSSANWYADSDTFNFKAGDVVKIAVEKTAPYSVARIEFRALPELGEFDSLLDGDVRFFSMPYAISTKIRLVHTGKTGTIVRIYKVTRPDLMATHPEIFGNVANTRTMLGNNKGNASIEWLENKGSYQYTSRQTANNDIYYYIRKGASLQKIGTKLFYAVNPKVRVTLANTDYKFGFYVVKDLDRMTFYDTNWITETSYEKQFYGLAFTLNLQRVDGADIGDNAVADSGISIEILNEYQEPFVTQAQMKAIEDKIEDIDPTKLEVLDEVSKNVGTRLDITIDTSTSPTWFRQIVLPAGTYVLYTHDAMRSSINIYKTQTSSSSNIIYHRDGTYPNSVYEFTIDEKGLSIGGYSSTSALVDFTIVEKNTLMYESYISEHDNIFDINLLNPPSMYDALIQNNMRSRKTNVWNDTNTLFSIVQFADIHGYTANVERMENFLGRYKDYVSDVVCVGDIVTSTFDNENILAGFPDIICTIGNHDAWVDSNSEHYSNDSDYVQTESVNVIKQKFCYDKFLANNISNWGVTQPTDAASQGKCYFYKDYVDGNSKLRVIFLDCMHYGVGADMVNNVSTQDTWFKGVLADALANSIPVVVSCHYYPTWVQASEVIQCAYSTTDVRTSDKISSLAPEAVEDFIGDGGDFVCWIAGHSHMDILYIPQQYPHILVVGIDCGKIPSSGNSARVAGTKTQDCFNIVAFDPFDKLVKIVRVGSDSTRYLQSKRCVVYRYANFTDPDGVTHNAGLVTCQ